MALNLSHPLLCFPRGQPRRLRLSQQSLRSAGFVLRLSALRQCNLICNTAFACPTRFCNLAFACPTRFAVQLLSDQILQSLSNQTCNLVSPFGRICDSAAHPGCCLAAAVPLHDSRCHIASLLQSYSMVRIRRPAGFAISHAAAAGARPPAVRTPRTTLYCRQADSAAADEKYFCAPVELDL